MQNNLLINRIQEVVLVIEKEIIGFAPTWLDINSYACQILGCTPREFCMQASTAIETKLEDLLPGQKTSIRINGGDLFEEKYLSLIVLKIHIRKSPAGF